MNSTKLIKLLQTLDPTEFRRLHQFLQSPYYNYNQHLIKLYQLLRKYYPDFTAPRLTKERVFQKLFPEDTFDINKMRKLMSALTQLVEEYLISLHLKKDHYQRDRMLTAIYRQRNLAALYQKNTRDLIRDLEQSPYRNRDYYLALAQLNEELFFHPDTDKQQTGKPPLDQAMAHLDAYYLLSKLQLGAEMKTRENILAETYDIRLLEASVRLSREYFVDKNPLYRMYLRILDLHGDHTDGKIFSEVLVLFRQVMPNIARSERQNILQHLLNHCIRLINQGQSEYKQTLFELYQLGIEYDLIVENDYISDITFSNIVATGASLKAFDWVKIFMDQNAAYLKTELREDTKALCLALWYFNQEQYDRTVHSLLGHHFSDILNHLKSRCLLLRTHFEQFLRDETYYDMLVNEADAFDKFIRRHKKIAADKRKAYLNFIKLTKSLALNKDDKEEVAKLQQLLNRQSLVTYREWLMQKMELLR